MKIRLLAYCVMDNHYHLVLENGSGRMSDFLRLLNGQYGMNYRKREGGIGYVFQNRYKSTLIENDSYLVQSILYLLRNPARAGIVQLPEDYIWSSAKHYFSDKHAELVDQAFVNGL
jgi:REP element-mobilizing transposase RayT